MDEGDAPAARAGARQVIDQDVARGPAGGERLVQIGHAITDVVNAGAAPGQESGDRTVRGSGLQEFDFRATEVERDDSGAVGLFRGAGNHSEHITIECQRGVDAFDRDTDVGNDRLIRHGRVAMFQGFNVSTARCAAPKK